MHPTSMHIDFKHKEPTNGPVKQEEKTVSAKSHVNHPVSMSKTSMIVPVYVSTYGGPETLCYAMLDTQSDSSWISEETVRRMKTKGPTIDLTLATMGSEQRIKAQKIKDLYVRSYGGGRRHKIRQAYTRSSIPCDVDHIPTDETARR